MGKVTWTNCLIHSFPCSRKNIWSVSIPCADNKRYPLLLLLLLLFGCKFVAGFVSRTILTGSLLFDTTGWGLLGGWGNSPLRIFSTLSRSFPFEMLAILWVNSRRTRPRMEPLHLIVIWRILGAGGLGGFSPLLLLTAVIPTCKNILERSVSLSLIMWGTAQRRIIETAIRSTLHNICTIVIRISTMCWVVGKKKWNHGKPNERSVQILFGDKREIRISHAILKQAERKYEIRIDVDISILYIEHP